MTSLILVVGVWSIFALILESEYIIPKVEINILQHFERLVSVKCQSSEQMRTKLWINEEMRRPSLVFQMLALRSPAIKSALAKCGGLKVKQSTNLKQKSKILVFFLS